MKEGDSMEERENERGGVGVRGERGEGGFA